MKTSILHDCYATSNKHLRSPHAATNESAGSENSISPAIDAVHFRAIRATRCKSLMNGHRAQDGVCCGLGAAHAINIDHLAAGCRSMFSYCFMPQITNLSEI